MNAPYYIGSLITVITTNITSSQAQDLAATFVKWFYEMMNSSTVPSNTATEFKPDHFFADADAQISLQPSPGDVSAQAGAKMRSRFVG